jgi:hypothetical protein
MPVEKLIELLAGAPADQNKGFPALEPVAKAQLSVALAKYNKTNPPIFIRSYPKYEEGKRHPVSWAVVKVSAPL